jgi:tRNA pseudouridine13 synthase
MCSTRPATKSPERSPLFLNVSAAPPSLPAFERSAFPPRVAPVSYLAAAVPGTGGTLKARPEDFQVEELPAYEPGGSGEHLYIMIQKTGLSTLQMVSIVARHFRVQQGAVGFAGLKDKDAVTRQVVSVHLPGKNVADFPALGHPKLTVLWSDLHGNKLRRGHLRGNRFTIKIRDVEPGKVVHAKRTLDMLTRLGLPNRYGEQRFGRAQNNHLIGRAFLVGDDQAAITELFAPPGPVPSEHAVGRALFLEGKYAQAADTLPPGAEAESVVMRNLAAGRPPRTALRNIGYTARSFYLSSFQSAVFNAVLDQRLADGTWNQLLEGDLAFKHENGAVFSVDAPAMADPATMERLQAMLISPSGPMWGLAMTRAAGSVGEIEDAALRATGITPDTFEAFKREWGEELRGDRRALRVPFAYSAVEGGADEHGYYIKCVFDLPAGSFATVVMREIIKPASAPAAAGDEP